MKNIIGLSVVGSIVMAAPAWAEQSLYVAFPPKNHKTTAEKISLIGTAGKGEVLVNGTTIARSSSGHFAPQFPLQLGENTFTIKYKNQQTILKVTRQTTEPQPVKPGEFAKDSLTPREDISRLPGELICFGAIASPNANVSVQIGDQTIPLANQNSTVNLPPNSGALTQNNQPIAISGAGQYLGCAAAKAAAELGRPQFELSMTGEDGKPVTTKQEGPAKINILSPAQLEIAEVIVDGGITRTGPSTDYARVTPLPKGTRASVTGREGEWVRLDYGAWIKGEEVRIVPGSVPPRSLIRSITSRQVDGATQIIFPLQVPVPLIVQQGDRQLVLTLYNTTAQTDIIRLGPDPVISRLDWQQVMPGMVQYNFNLKSAQQWGYKVEYRGTTLVLTLRHPPKRIKAFGKPLAGIKILLDPGHGGKESGAPGPTGYLEKDVNLIMAKLIRDRLLEKGATVYMTREEDKDVSLKDRVTMIENIAPAIAVSIHYNSLPDDGDMLNTKGMGAFWYHPQAHSLAVFMHNYIVEKAGRPSYGVFWDNLALARPAAAPSVLLELGFMSNPQEFEWVVNPQEQRKLAVKVADGITQWFAIAK